MKYADHGSPSNDLVVSKGQAASDALLRGDLLHVSMVTLLLAAGLGDRLVGVEEPEDALLEVLLTTNATAIKLREETRGQEAAAVYDSGLIIRWKTYFRSDALLWS